MSMVGKTLRGLLVTCLLVTGPAFASPEVEKELAEMRELVEGLKQRVEAQEEQLEHQGGMLEDAQTVVREQQQEEDGTLSGVGEFWQAIDVNMSVAGSYAYNFHNPSNVPGGSGAGLDAGASGFFYPFHPDHNSFQVDQVWLDIGKKPTDESRAGFQFSILYGTTAAFLGQGGNLGSATVPTDLDGDGTPDVILSGGGSSFDVAVAQTRRARFDSTSDYYIHQAYVSYLAPLGEGVRVDVGKFATLLGAEVADASKNFNVTRGNLYNLLQPIDHLGVLTSTNVGPIVLAAGVVNEGNFSRSSPDINSEKSYLGKVGFATDTFSVANSVLYGADGLLANRNQRRTGVYDLLATFNGEGFSAWANADYVWVEGRQLSAWGLALAGQVPLTDVLSAALRLEYLRDKGTGTTGSDFFGIVSPFSHSEIYGATGTLAYELAENLTVKGEVRYDRVIEEDFGGAEAFLTNTANGDNDQVVGLAQVIYAF